MALLLAATSPASASPPVLRSIRVESTNVVIVAEIPAGSPAVVLEGSSSPDVAGWSPRSVVRPDTDQTSVEFRLPNLQENELLRVRIGRESSLPASAFRRRTSPTVEVVATTTNSAPGQAAFTGPDINSLQSLGTGSGPLSLRYSARLDPDLILTRPTYSAPLFAKAGGLRIIASGSSGLFFALEQTNGTISPVASVPLSGTARRLLPIGSGHLAVVEGTQEFSYSPTQTRLSVFDLAMIPPKAVASAIWPESFVEAAATNNTVHLVTQATPTNGWTTETRIRSIDLTVRSNVLITATTNIPASPYAASIESGALVLVASTPTNDIVWTAELASDGTVLGFGAVPLTNSSDTISGIVRNGRNFAVVTVKWSGMDQPSMALQSFLWNTGLTPALTGSLDLGAHWRVVVDPLDGRFIATASDGGGATDWGAGSPSRRPWTDTNTITVYAWTGLAGPELVGTTTNLGHLRSLTIRGDRMLVRSGTSTNSAFRLDWFGLGVASGIRLLDQLAVDGRPDATGEYALVDDGFYIPNFRWETFDPLCRSEDHFWLNQVHYGPRPSPGVLAIDLLSVSTRNDHLILKETIPSANISITTPDASVSSGSGLDLVLCGWNAFTLGRSALGVPVVSERSPIAWESKATYVRSGFRIDIGYSDAVVVPAGSGQPVLGTTRLISDWSWILSSWIHSNHLCVAARSTVIETNELTGDPLSYQEVLLIRTFRLDQLPALPLVAEASAPFPESLRNWWAPRQVPEDGQGRVLMQPAGESEEGDFIFTTFTQGFSMMTETYGYFSDGLFGLSLQRLLSFGGRLVGISSPFIRANWDLKPVIKPPIQLLTIDASNPAAPKIGRETTVARPASSRTKVHFSDGLAFQGSTTIDASIIATNFVVRTGQVWTLITNTVLQTNVVATPLPAPLTNLVTISQSYPLRSLAWPDAREIAGGGAHQLALDRGGVLWAWGEGTFGQLGDGSMTSRLEPRSMLSNVASIAAGFRSTLAVRDDGSVWFSGFNILQPPPVNPLGLPPLPIFGSLTPQLVEGIPPVVSASAGFMHFMALAADGSAWGWGDNSFGQLGLTTNIQGAVPVTVSNLPPLKAIAAGGWHTLLLTTNGDVLSAGRNHFGQLGRTALGEDSFAQVPGVSNVVQVAADLYASAALDRKGAVWIWGRLPSTSASAAPTNALSSPEPVRIPTAAKAIAMQGTHLAILDVDGRVWTWGSNPTSTLFPSTLDPAPVAGISNAVALAADRSNGAVLTEDGRLVVFGDAMQILGGDSVLEIVQATHKARVIVTHSFITNIAPVAVMSSSLREVVATNALPVYRWSRSEWLDVVDFTDVSRPVLRPRQPLPAALLAVTHHGEVLYTRHLNTTGSGIRFAALAYDGAAVYDLSELQLEGSRVPLADASVSNQVWTAWGETNGLVHLQCLRLDPSLALKAAQPIGISSGNADGLVLNSSEGNLLSAEDSFGSTVIRFKADGTGRVVAEDRLMDQCWDRFQGPVFDPEFGWFKSRGYGAIRRLEIPAE